MNDALLSSKNMCWCTPPDFFAELNREFHFELDPASTDKSAKCAKHFTPDDDGLKQDWGGYCVFCNPPYGRAIADWVRKGYEESRKPVTIMASNIVNTQQGTFSDDGVSQQAIIKTGVTTKDAAFVPNPVSLIPYRTFLEVPQPASDFVFRISEGRGGAPAFKLVAADGGLWKSQAVDNVKNYLVKALADVPDREKITIIA